MPTEKHERGTSFDSNLENICINGSFIVNQLGRFFNRLVPRPSQNTFFLIDMWEIDLDNKIGDLSIKHFPEGIICFEGNGQAGGVIKLRNQDLLNPGTVDFNDSGHITSVFGVRLGEKSQALNFRARPRAVVSESDDLVFTRDVENAIIGQGVGTKRDRFEPLAIQRVDRGAAPLEGNELNIILTADGDFEFYVFDAREFNGSYYEAPLHGQLSPIQELMRVKFMYEYYTNDGFHFVWGSPDGIVPPDQAGPPDGNPVGSPPLLGGPGGEGSGGFTESGGAPDLGLGGLTHGGVSGSFYEIDSGALWTANGGWGPAYLDTSTDPPFWKEATTFTPRPTAMGIAGGGGTFIWGLERYFWINTGTILLDGC